MSRGYLNLTGSLSHWFSSRVTPDITRETGAGSSISGSQTFRLKYAYEEGIYGQVNFDDFATKGSWFRFGAHQTPWLDYTVVTFGNQTPLPATTKTFALHTLFNF